MTVEVCLTPTLIHQHDLANKIVVVIDIFRATSCMVAGLGSGVKAIYPVATVDECLALGEQGMIMAGERGGQKLETFDIGNSPFDYMSSAMKGKEIAVSTTNGTLAIEKSRPAAQVIIGAFLNLSSVLEHLRNREKDTVLHCAGWKGTPNLEDTLFAGAVIEQLGDITLANDASILALSSYQHCKDDLLSAGQNSSHAQRLGSLGVTKDIEYCLKKDQFDVLPILDDNRLVKN